MSASDKILLPCHGFYLFVCLSVFDPHLKKESNNHSQDTFMLKNLFLLSWVSFSKVKYLFNLLSWESLMYLTLKENIEWYKLTFLYEIKHGKFWMLKAGNKICFSCTRCILYITEALHYKLPVS